MGKKNLKKLIKVTQTDIENGIQNDPRYCPIAKAIQRTWSRDWTVSVWDTTVCIKRRRRRISRVAKLSPAARRFMMRFDDGEEVKPFETQLTFE